MLSKLTPQLKYVFTELDSDSLLNNEDSTMRLRKELTDFFVALQPRGILTCLGVRRTSSSIDEELPPEKN